MKAPIATPIFNDAKALRIPVDMVIYQCESPRNSSTPLIGIALKVPACCFQHHLLEC
jgi:hypothetical protein